MSNKLTYNGKVYDDVTQGTDKLMQANAFVGDSLPAASLPVDTLSAVVRDYDLEPRLLVADGVLAIADGNLAVAQRASQGIDVTAKYGANVSYHKDESLVGKFKLENITRIGRYEYQITCISAIGLLLTDDHYGGIYEGETASAVIADIIGGIFTYTLDTTLGAVPLYGLLRKRSRRDNLRDVLFAIGGQIRKTVAGEVNIVPMAAGTAYEITADEFYMGGSVTGGNPATGIAVTEHSFVKLPSDEIVTLYDGESAAETLVTPKGKTVSGVLVDFSEPVYDLVIQNAEILESGANYAVISGSPAAVLTGKEYTHTERIITRSNNTGGSPNVLSSSECTLVNLMNSELVADRLMAYYGHGKTIEAEIVVDGQKPGDAVAFTDPFGEPTTGYISEMELTMSAITKASTKIVSGFIPTASGNYYSNLTVFTAAGNYTATKDGKIRVVCIGGGNGGEAGQAGTAGQQGTSSESGAPGEGGAPGAGGKPGKVFIITIPVKVGQTFSARPGTGGSGAAFGGSPGKGTASTFGSYSSDNGYAPDAGYSALISGAIYALPGESGVKGGDGQSVEGVTPGEQTTVIFQGQTWYSGKAGETVLNGLGAGGAGGLGGGPAVGANGGDGTSGAVSN